MGILEGHGVLAGRLPDDRSIRFLLGEEISPGLKDDLQKLTWFQSRLWRDLKNGDIIFAAITGSPPVGWASLTYGYGGHAVNIFVHPNYRGRGVANKLGDALVKGIARRENRKTTRRWRVDYDEKVYWLANLIHQSLGSTII